MEMPRKYTNPLLLPIEVGKSKPAVVDLPPADHIYGIKSNLDCEGAGSVIGGWLEHQPNAAAIPGRDFKTLNRMAIMSGNGVTATQVASFRREHDARLKGGHERVHQGVHLPSSQDPVFSYGIKSGERIPMDSIMSNQYLKDFLSQQEVKQEQHQLAKKHIPVMHTKASLGHRFVEPVNDTSKPFKMKKFLNVPPRLRAMADA
uniref:Uncharacterized protein n=1 Tax=Cryptomonas curvata TaxID=233186 RepID=A0A7S0QIX2_9CRYP